MSRPPSTVWRPKLRALILSAALAGFVWVAIWFAVASFHAGSRIGP